MPTPFDIIHAVDLTQGIVTRGSVAHSISRKALRQACAREFQPSLGLPSVLERTDVVDPANYVFWVTQSGDWNGEEERVLISSVEKGGVKRFLDSYLPK